MSNNPRLKEYMQIVEAVRGGFISEGEGRKFLDDLSKPWTWTISSGGQPGTFNVECVGAGGGGSAGPGVASGGNGAETRNSQPIPGLAAPWLPGELPTLINREWFGVWGEAPPKKAPTPKPWKCKSLDCKTPTAGPGHLKESDSKLLNVKDKCSVCQDRIVFEWQKQSDVKRSLRSPVRGESPAYYGPRESTMGGAVNRPGSRWGTWR